MKKAKESKVLLKSLPLQPDISLSISFSVSIKEKKKGRKKEKNVCHKKISELFLVFLSPHSAANEYKNVRQLYDGKQKHAHTANYFQGHNRKER